MRESLQSIEQRVSHIIHRKMGVKGQMITPDAHLKHHLGLDSLDEVELIMEIEKEFDITIPDEEAEEFAYVKDILYSIAKKHSL